MRSRRRTLRLTLAVLGAVLNAAWGAACARAAHSTDTPSPAAPGPGGSELVRLYELVAGTSTTYFYSPMLAGGPTQPARDPGYALRVPGSVYTLHRDPSDTRGLLFRGVVPYVYTNPQPRAAALPGCAGPEPPQMERWDGRDWVLVYDPVVARCGRVPTFVPAGATRQDVFEFRAGPDSLLRHEGPLLPLSLLPGRFRLVRQVVDSGPGLGGQLRPIAERTSNTFELQAAPGGTPDCDCTSRKRRRRLT